jgi:hypothetical protein
MVFCCSLAHASGGACPASSPVAGNTSCFFIAGNGNDSNSGTDELHPWAHSPGMITCSANCATEQTALGGGNNNGGQSHPGVGFIFRGGDTWHFSNPSPGDGMPYTGGVMYSLWGSNTNCVYEGNQTGCFYWGVDTSWFNSTTCGASFCRPIFDGDNPTSTAIVSSCPYPTRTINPFDRTNTSNNIFVMANDTQTGVYVDNIEFTGLCSNDTTDSGRNANNDTYLIDGSDTDPTRPNFIVNVYIHGWTVTTAEINAGNSMPNCTVIGGGSFRVMDHLVIDGADSNGRICNAFQWPRVMHMRDSLVRYTVNINTAAYHDVHDNVIEHFAGGIPTTHGNFWENNADYAASGSVNVWYNNVMRHNDPSFASQGYVGQWFCPNTTPEYWFNNIQYDMAQASGVMWSVVGPPTYGGCTNAGNQYSFNNTIVDSRMSCSNDNNNTNGQYLYIDNHHMINAGYVGTTCHGGPSSTTNVAQTDQQATTQGYTTGTSGVANNGNNCANDSTKPCSPTSASASTVGAGVNHQDYCNTLAAFTGDPSIAIDAATACRQSTTDACAYNSSTHTMTCPAQTPVARPTSGAWDSGAYQFNGVNTPPSAPSAPAGLAASVH